MSTVAIVIVSFLGYFAVAAATMRYLYTEHATRDDDHIVAVMASIWWPIVLVAALGWFAIGRPLYHWIKKPYRHLPKKLRGERD